MITSEKAISIIQNHGGVISTDEALKAGIAPKTFYAMRDQGILIRLSRGLYRLADAHPPGRPDLLTVSKRLPKAVIALISALDYYGLTEQVPHFVYIALPQKAEMPRFDYPPLQIVWLSQKTYSAGIREISIDNTTIKIYSSEKTLADCFKFRNKLGLDVAIDALKRYFERSSKEQDLNALMEFSQLNRVEKIITPYIESLI
jgi:predicted transcriptional regulator of viral defense system